MKKFGDLIQRNIENKLLQKATGSKKIMTPSELSSDNENHYGILIKRDLFYKMTYFYNTKQRNFFYTNIGTNKKKSSENDLF